MREKERVVQINDKVSALGCAYLWKKREKEEIFKEM
tara:strand:+ start:735 stop:842 length:108 start_codon:yes stop_codon:yes gene_type:complete